MSPPITRRSLLRAAAVGAVAAVAGCRSGGATPPGPTTSTTRRATPRPPVGTTASPSSPASTGPRPATPAAWRALGEELEGTLVRPGDAAYAEAKALFNPRWDSLRPAGVVQARSAHDVAAAVDFAARHGLQCRPKSGGHSYVGASSVTGGLVVDVGPLDQVSYDSATQVVDVGAGATLYPVHVALAGHGRTIPTGTCPTVGAAGLTLGGGVGVASRDSGLTCDQLVGVQLVTADGRVREAGAGAEPELFWASRGGGGGSFGVVTGLRYRTQPAPPRTGFFFLSFPWTKAAEVLAGWASRVRAMPATTWANLHLVAGSTGSAEVSVVGVCRAGSENAEAQAMESAAGVSASSADTATHSFLGGVQLLGGGTTSARQGFAAGSDVVAAMTPGLAAALVGLVDRRAASRQPAAVILDPLTGAVQALAPTATAFPWRRHLADIQWYLSLPAHPTTSQVRSAFGWIDAAHRAVATWSAGGYVNYLEPGLPLARYFGPNLARLRRVKAAYDPAHVFRSPWSVR